MSAGSIGAPTRRGVLAGAGALVLAFRLAPSALAAEGGGKPGSLATTPRLDAWIRVEADGGVSVFTGKAELGQGIRTALTQIAADELEVAPGAIRLVTADTGLTPNEGYTAGSHSVDQSGTAILHAAAQVRERLIALAAERLGIEAAGLRAEDGAVVAPDGRRLSYRDLVAGLDLHLEAAPTSTLKDPSAHRVIGTPLPRVDIPRKLTGGEAYVQDLRLPGMLHARVVRPAAPGSTLTALDATEVERMPGVVGIVRDGGFLAVVAEREFGAVVAARALGAAATWSAGRRHPGHDQMLDHLAGLPAQSYPILERGDRAGADARVIEAKYRRNYHLHGSIGPSCAVALFEDGQLTVWSHGQGMFPLRTALAEMLRMPAEAIRCVHKEGAGCYGHNGADDAAADAALIARAMPRRPIRVQWMRADEHVWEPYGSGMLTSARAALSPEGTITDWVYEVRSCSHLTRPPGAGQLLAARYLEEPFAQPVPKPQPQPEGGGDRNAIPLYAFANARVVHHFVPEMPVRVSALRGLGAYMNVFSIESFMDELAAAAGADPVAFRLRHLEDPRARDVIGLAAERFGWPRGRPGARNGAPRGRGLAFARYKNLGAYAAVAVEVEVAPQTGLIRVVRAVAAVDSGTAVNPDGIRLQVEGGIVQSASWTLYEQVTFNEERTTSRDWSTYPIMRFSSVPERVEVHVLDRPGTPFLGTGEAAQGPTAAAIANAVADATGLRLREIPFTRARVKAAMDV